MHTALSLSSLLLPVVPTAFLSRLVTTGLRPAVRFLVQVVTYTLLVLLPVQLLAVGELVGSGRQLSLLRIFQFQVALALLCMVGWLAIRPRLLTATRATTQPGHLRLSRLAISCLAIAALCYGVFALDAMTSFPKSWDGNAYHLPMALRWLQDGSLRIDLRTDWRFSIPANAEIPMMILLGSGLSPLVFLSQVPALAGLAVAAYVIARRLSAGSEASVLAAIVVLSVPIVIHQVFAAYVDLYGTSFFLIGLALLLSRAADGGPGIPSRRQDGILLLFAALSCGVALGTKSTFSFYVAAFTLSALLQVVLSAKGQFGATLPAAVVLLVIGLLLPSGFWFGRAYGATGNPLFPLRVTVGGRTIFNGPVVTKTVDTSDHNDVKSLRGLLTYPWTERRFARLSGGPVPELTSTGRNTADSGLGAPFATFVPLGLIVLLISVVSNRSGPIGVRTALMLWVALGSLVWRFGMGSVIRYGLPLVCLGCVLSAVLLDELLRGQRRLASLLLVASFAIAFAITAFDPIRAILGRARRGDWSHRQFYGLPAAVERFPEGTRVLNWARDETLNFPLAGERLQNRVIPQKDAPRPLTAEFLREWSIDYVVERGPRRGDGEDLSRFGALAGTAEGDDAGSALGLRVWKIARDR